MALKTERPADGADGGLVVFVAHSPDEVERARAALADAGVPLDLPQAAAIALFEQGRRELPLRVPPRDYKRALNAIDAAFPRAEVDLPGAPDDEDDDAGSPGDASPPAARPEPGDADSAGPHLEHFDPGADAPPARVASGSKLEGSGVKLIAIAIGAALVPLFGVLLSGFVIYAGTWLKRHPKATPKAQARGTWAIGLGVVGILTQLVWAYLASR